MLQYSLNPFTRVSHNQFGGGRRFPRVLFHATHIIPGIPALILLLAGAPLSLAFAFAIVGAVFDKLVQPRWRGFTLDHLEWRGWQVTNYADFMADLIITLLTLWLPACWMAVHTRQWWMVGSVMILFYVCTIFADPFPDSPLALEK